MAVHEKLLHKILLFGAIVKQQQEAHGIGQIEQQLNHQMEAAVEIQGQSKLDQEMKKATHRHLYQSNKLSE
ncbi:hypothetical protein N6H13_00645 [Paenibacillus sp. CC-CFT742]|nr:hypothetical protein [Paenibacillus sp. CC-CFT742]WJH29350.1 hypothetical protein N6H13_00645 [Paenibacillus sp. CC-CFT742]